MTLKEKFGEVDKFTLIRESHNVKCEEIADENAIEFGKWMNNQVLNSDGTHHRLRGRILVPDLYVIYKKEKGL